MGWFFGYININQSVVNYKFVDYALSRSGGAIQGEENNSVIARLNEFIRAGLRYSSSYLDGLDIFGPCSVFLLMRDCSWTSLHDVMLSPGYAH